MSKFLSFFSRKNKSHNPVKKNRMKGVNLFFCALFSLCALGGTAVSSYYAIKNNTKSSEFSSSYDFKIELDTKYVSEDPLAPASASHIEAINKEVKNTADVFSRVLLKEGINQFKVFPEFYPNITSPADSKAYISLSVPNKYVDEWKTPSGEETKKTDFPSWLLYIQTAMNSRISLWFNQDGNTVKENAGTYSVITKEQMINGNASTKYIKKDPTNPKNIYINIQDPNGDWSVLYKDFEDAANGESGSNDDAPKRDPILYMIRDQNSFINKMNLLLNMYYYNFDNNLNDAPKAYRDFSEKQIINGNDNNPYHYLSSSETKFATDFYDNSISNPAAPSDFGIIQSAEHSGNANNNKTSFVPWDNLYDKLVAPYEIVQATTAPSDVDNYFSFINYIDAGGSVGENGSAGAIKSDFEHTGNISYDWMNDYVLASITKTNYTSYFPDKEPGKTSDSKNPGKFLVISLPTTYDANLLYDQLTNFGLNSDETLPFLTIENTSNEFSTLNGIDQNIVNNNALFLSALFIKDPLLGAAIALLTIVLLIALIVSLLYRVPGAYCVLYSLLISALVFLILMLSGFAISLGVLTAMFLSLFLNFFLTTQIMEKIKKFSKQSDLLYISFIKGIKNSLALIADLNILTIIAAIFFIYLGASDVLLSFGLYLLLFSALNLAVIILMCLPNIFFFFKTKINWNYKYIFKHNMNQEIQPVLLEGNKKIDVTYSGVKMFSKVNIFFSGWKKWIIPSIFAVIVVVGIVLMATLGVSNSYFFFGGTRVGFVNEANAKDFKEAFNMFGNITHENGWYFLYSTQILNLYSGTGLNIQNWFTEHSIAWGSYSFANVSSVSTIKAFVDSIILIVLLILAVFVYSIFRIGFFASVPLLISLIASSVIIFAFVGVSQLPIDTNVILSIVTITYINFLFTFVLSKNLYNDFVKKNNHSLDELRIIFKEEIKNSMHIYTLAISFLCLSFAILLLLSSTSLIFFYLFLLTSSILVFAFLFTVFPTILIFFINVKYKINMIIVKNEAKKINYDSVDEQSIEKINFFKKRRIEI